MSARLIGSLTVATVFAALIPASAGAATINVDILTDEFTNNGNCSLREAVQSANVDGVAQLEAGCEAGDGTNDRIQLGANTYTLTTPILLDDIASGDLEVTDTDPLTVIGQGVGSTVIDGGEAAIGDRVFEVNPGNASATPGLFTVQGITVQNGEPTGNGGAILANASVTLQSARLTSNETGTGNGGAILVNGTGRTLTLNSSNVDVNTAGGTGTGGGIEIFGGASLVTNGASAIDSNTAGSQGGGIDLQNGVTASITLNQGTTVNNNTAVALGGGIAVTTGSNLTANGVTIQDNGVNESGGGLAKGGGIHYVGGPGQLQLTDTFVENNNVDGDNAAGGGINALVNTGGVSLTRTAVENNDVIAQNGGTAGETLGGGGLALDGAGASTITDSLFAANTVTVNDADNFAGGGGILDLGSLTVDRVAFWINDISGGAPPAGWNGGGLYAFQTDGPTRVLNSIFAGNVLGISGTGAGFASGGSQPTTLVHSTFAGNVGGLGDSFNPFGGGSFTVRANVFDDGATSCFPDPLVGVNGYNVDPGTSCVGGTNDTDLENTDPTLGPPVDNGGPLIGGPAMESTRTLELSGPAAVFDLVPPANCLDLASAPLTVDQRGAPRPTDAGCEPGSYEIVRCLGVPAYIGTGGNDVIDAVFLGANEAFLGLGGNDTINGDGDANRLCGGSGNDMLVGFAGNDMIDGGAGGDQLLGQADMDNLLARDGEADLVDCGTEADTAQTDRLSLDSVTGCESVDALAEPPVITPITPQPTPSNAAECAALRAKLKKAKSKKKKRKIRAQLKKLGC